MKFVNVTMQFDGMRKPQEFTIYPVLPTDGYFIIQSDKRIGRVSVADRTIYLSKGHSNGSYYADLYPARGAKLVGLTEEQYLVLMAAKDKMASVTRPDRSIQIIFD